MQKLIYFTLIVSLALLAAGCNSFSKTGIDYSNSQQMKPMDGVQQYTSDRTQQKNLDKTSLEYARMSRISWSAFQCSMWASLIDDDEEAERQFKLGYKKGIEFLSALESQKIEDKDFRSEVPIGVSMNLSGPSNDFILGIIYSAATDDAFKSIQADLKASDWEEIQRTKAMVKYQDSNCSLINE
ncbi:hypothetical protein KKG46_01225 [Patescibacteria group bacterium]|nr:hypothetical protein [Patescibacteria group bacterium]